MLAKIQLSCPPSPGLVRPLYHMSHDGLIPPDGGQCRHGGRHSLHHQDLWGLSLEKRARVSCHIFLSLRKRYHSPLPDNLGLKMLAKKGEGGWWSHLCQDFLRDLQVPVSNSPLGWDRHEICPKKFRDSDCQKRVFREICYFATKVRKNGLKWD